MRRVLIYVVIAAAIGTIFYFYHKLSVKTDTPASSLDAVPLNVSFIIQADRASELTTTRELCDVLAPGHKEYGLFSDGLMLINWMDSIVTNDQAWANSLSESSVSFARNNQGWFVSAGLRQNSGFEQLLPGGATDRKFQDVTIYSDNSLHYMQANNCLVISPSPAVMEDIVIAVSKKALITSDPVFMDSFNTRSADAVVHLAERLNEKEWLLLDPFIREDVRKLLGYAVMADKPIHSFGLASGHGHFNIVNALPASTVMLDAFSYDTFEEGWRTHESFNEGNASRFWQQAWKELGDSCQCDLNEMMLSWRNGEWGSAIINTSDTTTSEVLYYGVRDSIDVLSLMSPLISRAGNSGMYELNFPMLFDRNRPATVLVEANYITQVNGFVFTAATPTDLSVLKNITQPLSSSPSFTSALKGMSGNESRITYLEEFYVSPLPVFTTQLLSGQDYVAAGIEKAGDGKCMINIVLPPAEEAVAASVETEVPVTVLHGPWKVINHNTGNSEKLLQDSDKQLCLFDATGKLLWKKKLDGEIIGDVTQVDALRNGKLQMAFTTNLGLHILDRNGKELQGFPVLPETPVTSPLHVADYENDKKYRLLFAGGDGYVNNYTVKGAVTEGWRSRAGIRDVVAIRDFRSGKSDYILLVSATGELEILGRTGDLKLKPTKRLEDYSDSSVVITPGDNLESTIISYTAKSGEVKTVVIGG